MDELDSRIISLLQADGRASNAKIARDVGVSEGTVRRRLRHLIQGDVIKVIAVPNLEQMGYGTAALVGIQTDPGGVDEVASAITALDEAHYVAITTGAYDIFAWVGVESPERLGTFLRSKVGTIPGVRRTETFVNLTIKKRTYGLIL
jgi:Lrp/AsnC family transcriptional regulator for asnA, asnC and gidA